VSGAMPGGTIADLTEALHAGSALGAHRHGRGAASGRPLRIVPAQPRRAGAARRHAERAALDGVKKTLTATRGRHTSDAHAVGEVRETR
jgi:hypothetical protein